MKNIQIRKILVIRLSSIGDIVLTTGFLRILRKKYPNSKIDFMIYNPFISIIENNPAVDEIIGFEKNPSESDISAAKSRILKKQGKYDIIFDLHNNSISNKISRDLSGNILKIDKRRLYKICMVWFKKGKGEAYKGIHDIYIEPLKNFDISDDNLGLEFWLSTDMDRMKYMPYERNFIHKGLLNIVVAPGAHYKTKRWNYVNYAHLIRKLKPVTDKITIIGGKDDSEIADKIAELNPGVINLCGKNDLTGTCEEINNSDLVITNDTGVMHIAAARKVPVAAFFGSTVREFGFEPYGVKHLIIESDQCCRPCTHIGRNFCPLIHFKCMNDITPDIAYSKITDFIRSIYL